MPARPQCQSSRIGTVLAGVLTASVAGGVLLMPTAAHAAEQLGAGSAKPLLAWVTGSSLGAEHTLTPGGSTLQFSLTVTNNSDEAESFVPVFDIKGVGAVPAASADALFSVSGVQGRASASTASLADGHVALAGYVSPTAGGTGKPFTVPAHATYDWQLAVGATRHWPVQDKTLALTLVPGKDTSAGSVTVSYPVATGTASASGSSAPAPSSSPTTVSVAPTTASATPAAPSSAATSPSSATASAGGSLASTGGGNNTGVLAGIALALVGAGSAVFVGLKRRAQRD
ncbi:hypothetical protein ACEZDB_01910 [Streptacidiphilus sp. N1-3]|uniref:LPXTG-motif cell wall anchor domain-containing protein n=1 Tax=Streptacidiphilus alkalitolerans TaxID=3342712 RepID=A0ABV6WTQ9_9ACTN